MARRVSVLFANRRSVYKQIAGLDVWDQERNARWFEGPGPIVAHPPCRAWSAFCRHQAIFDMGEPGLGPLAVVWLRRWGGVLEQPGHSLLWDHCGLPRPGCGDEREWSIEVEGAWFGTKLTRKVTWLCFFHIARREVPAWDLSLFSEGCEARRWSRACGGRSGRDLRSRTPLEMAEWLVSCAERVRL